MDEFSFLDDLEKRQGNKPKNSLGQAVNSAIDNTAQQPNMVLAPWATQQQPQKERGYLDAAMAGFANSTLATLADQAKAGSIILGTDGATAQYLGDKAQQYSNGKTEENQYTWEDRLMPWRNGFQYYTDPDGFVYEISGLGGSMAVLGAESLIPIPGTGLMGKVVGKAVPAAVKGLAGKVIPDTTARNLAERAIIQNAKSKPYEIFANAGGAGAEYLEQNPNDINGARMALAKEAIAEIPGAIADTALEVRGGLQMLRGGGAGGRVAGAIKSAGGNAYEEGYQNRSTKYALGNSTYTGVYNPLEWQEDDFNAASTGAIVGIPALGTAAVGNARAKYFNKNNQAQGNKAENQKDGQEIVQQEQDNQQPQKSEPAKEYRPAIISEDIEDKNLANTVPEAVNGVHALNSWAYDKFGKDIIVSGGWRSQENNAAVNGHPNSHHLYGQAVDMDLSSFTKEERDAIEQQAKAMGFKTLYHDAGTGEHLHVAVDDGTSLRTNIYTQPIDNASTEAYTTPQGASQNDATDNYINDLLYGDNSAANAVEAMNPEAQMFSDALQSSARLKEPQQTPTIPIEQTDEYIALATQLEELQKQEDSQKASLEKLKQKKDAKSVKAADKLEAKVKETSNKVKQAKSAIDLYKTKYLATNTVPRVARQVPRDIAPNTRFNGRTEELSAAKRNVDAQELERARVNGAIDYLEKENAQAQATDRRTDFANEPFMPQTQTPSKQGIKTLAEKETTITGKPSPKETYAEDVARQKAAKRAKEEKVRTVNSLVERGRKKQQNKIDALWYAAEHEKNMRGYANADEVRNSVNPKVLRAAESESLREITRKAMGGDHASQVAFDRLGKEVKAFLMQREIDRLALENDKENQKETVPDRAKEPFMPDEYLKMAEMGHGAAYAKAQEKVQTQKESQEKAVEKEKAVKRELVAKMVDKARKNIEQAKQDALDYEWLAMEHEKNMKGYANADEVRNSNAPSVKKAADSKALDAMTKKAMLGNKTSQRAFEKMSPAVKAFLMQREIDRINKENIIENQKEATPDRATKPFMPEAYLKLQREGRADEYEKVQAKVQEKKQSKALKEQEQLQKTSESALGDTITLNAVSARDEDSRTYMTRVMKEKGMTDNEISDLFNVVDSVVDAAEKIAKDNGFKTMEDWLERNINDPNLLYRVTDNEKYKATFGHSPTRSSFKKNGEYELNFDLGALCTKRESMDALVYALSQQVDGAELIQNLGPTQMEALKSMLKEEGFLTACDVCFVETKRVRALNDANKWAFEWKTVLEAAGINDNVKLGERESLTPEQQERLNELAGNVSMVSAEDAFNKYIANDSKLKERVRQKVGKNGDLTKGADLDSGITSSKAQKIAKIILEDTKLAGDFDPALLLTTHGTDYLVRTFAHTNIANTIASMYGAATAKPLEGFNIYDSLSWYKDFDSKNINKQHIYDIGGFRAQSFTDFNPILFVDYVQMFTDLQARQLPLHLYTKVPSLIELFGRSGAMMNMSLVPKIVDGAPAGLDKNGNYAWADESFPVEKAMELRKRKDFGGRVGTIAVGVSREHILKMLDDPEIDMIIPYHSSGMPASVKTKTGLDKATDYTKVQETKQAQKTEKPEGFQEKNSDPERTFDSYMQELKDARKAAQAYLDWCERNGCTPKFKEFSGHKNYYKLLENFRSYDEDGKPVIQGPVRMELTDNWQDVLKEALADRSKQAKKISEMTTAESAKEKGKKILDRARTILEKQRLDSDAREVMVSRLNTALGKQNVQCKKQKDFLDQLEKDGGDQQQVELFRNAKGICYGYAKGNKIVLNEDVFNADTPAHEFSHIWAKVAQKMNPELWAKGVELLKTDAKDVWDAVVNDPLYQNLKDDNAIADEVLARITGGLNEKLIREMTDPNFKMSKAKAINLALYNAFGNTRGNKPESLRISERLMNFLKDFFTGIRNFFKGKDFNNENPLTYEEFIRMPLKTLWNDSEGQSFKKVLNRLNKGNELSAEQAFSVTSGTFFSGGGLVDYALKSIIDGQFAVEFDKQIAGVYETNNGKHMFNMDVRDFRTKDFKGKVDYFHASPVCKNYSDAKSNAEELPLDMTTAQATADALRELKPKAFTLENVPKYRNSQAMKLITDALDELGYNYDIGVYDSADYGAATSRKRLLLRAFKDEQLPPRPKPIAKRTGWYSVVEDLIDTLPEVEMPQWMQERLDSNGIDIAKLDQPLLILHGNKSNGLSMAKGDKPAPTLVASDHDQRIIMPDGRVLKATPRVIARIQGLGDDYVLPKQSTLAYRVIGNGVPVKLTQAVFGPMLKQIDNENAKLSTVGEINEIRERYYGTDQWMKAPNGEKTNLTEKQWLQVRTPAFKEWFGDWENNPESASKIVDENGEPLVVYHGSSENFTVFDPTKARANMDIQGMFFSPWEIDAGGYGENVRAFFLNIKNPASEAAGYRALKSHQGENYAGRKAREDLIKKGYDGVNNSGEEYIAFNPNQVKSATDNIGAFSKDNDDIRLSATTNEQPKRTVTRQELQSVAEDIVPIRVEKARRDSAYKMYNRKANVGFVHTQGSIGELSGIVAMYIDNKKKLSENQELRDELVQNAWDYKQEQKQGRKFAEVETDLQTKEGAAYFGRLYVTDKAKAEKLFPKYYKAFESAVAKDKGLQEKLNSFTDTAEAYYQQTPEGKAKAGITNPFEKPKTNKEKALELFHEAYADWVDDKHILQRVEKQIEEITGEKIKINDSAYYHARMAASAGASRIDMAIKGAETVFGKKAGKGTEERKAWFNAMQKIYGKAWSNDVCYQDIVDEVEKVSKDYLALSESKDGMSALANYLLANRFLEIWETKPNYKASISRETAQKVVANAPKAIKDAAKMYYAFNNNLIQVMNKEGMLTDAGLEGMKKYTRYCPLFRDYADEAAFDKFMSKISNPNSYINLSNGIKALTEEGSDRTVLDDPVKSMMRMTASILGKVEKNKVAQKFVAMSDKSGVGNIIIPALDNKGEQLTTANPQESQFTVWIKGEKKAYKTIPELYDVLQGDPNYANNYLSLFDNMWVKTPAQTLRKGATISPGFIMANFMKDTMNAWVNSKNGYKPVVGTIKGIDRLVNDKEFRQEYLASGVNMAGYFHQDAKSLQDILDEMAGNKWWQKATMLEKIKTLWDHYETLGELVEQGTRAEEYYRARKNDKSMLEAAIDAKQVSSDFSRAGKKGREVNKGVSFFNAIIQGGDQMVRSAIDHPQRFAAIATGLALSSIMLWCVNQNDPDYEEESLETKMSNWHFKVGDKWVTIPVPQEFGMLTCGSVVATLEAFKQKNPKPIKEWARALVSNMLPVPFPVLYKPVIECIANYDFFFDSPVVAKKYQGLKEEKQINSNTSKVAELAGGLTGYSPIKIDHLIRGYFGGAGAFVARVPNKLLEDGKEPAKYWNEMPLFDRFIRTPSAHPKSVTEFYDLRDEITKEYNTNHSNEADMKYIRKMGTIVSGLRKDIEKIKANKVLSSDRKRELINNKNNRILQVAKKAVQQYGNKYL